MKSVNLIYFSASGTTKSVVSTLYQGLGCDKKKEYDLLQQPPKQAVTIAADTPAVFAVPVYAGRVPAVCADMLKQFKGMNTPAVAIVVYGNRDYDDALLELTDILKANGFIVVAAAAFVAQHSLFPEVAKGRPDKKDEDIIKEFGEKCNTAFAEFTGTENITVKGNTPYCEAASIPLKPSGDSKCNACGACVKVCPTNAITTETPHKTDESRCISCTACIAVCPQNARNFHNPLYAIVGEDFSKKNMTRKEAELFTDL